MLVRIRIRVKTSNYLTRLLWFLSKCSNRANRTNCARTRELIVTLAILIAMFYFIPQYVFRVSGRSMYPTLEDGDYVVIWRAINGNLTNEIVLFEDHTNKLIVHRAIANNSEMVMTKGDANKSPDGWITRENVIGFVLFVIPGEVMILPSIAFLIIILVSIGYEVFAHFWRKRNGK
ncbi:MAG: signal peptidase I [Candidatus Bathyarchaeia archaeon]